MRRAANQSLISSEHHAPGFDDESDVVEFFEFGGCFHEGVFRALSDGLEIPKDRPIVASRLSKDFMGPPEGYARLLEWMALEIEGQVLADTFEVALQFASTGEGGLNVRQDVFGSHMLAEV